MLNEELIATVRELQQLMFRCVQEGGAATGKVQEYLQHGIGRRVGVVMRALQKVFELFPLSTVRPLNRETLSDVQINLHAFVMNLYGIFDNLAWAFVFKHELKPLIDNRLAVGMFKSATRKHLPTEVRTYLETETMSKWHEDYLKNYRDALAHRIALYIPPSELTKDEGERFNVLESEKIACIRAMNWARLDEVYAEQAVIGRPSFMFLHSYAGDESPKSILLHPQLLCDAKTVSEFGALFFKHWGECEA